jgi:hypothetical protein
MRILGYDGQTFALINSGTAANPSLAAGVPEDINGPDVQPIFLPRLGANARHVGIERGVKSIPVKFSVRPGYNVEQTFQSLLGALDTLNDDERLLQGELNDGTDVELMASVGGNVYERVNSLIVTFYATDPVWRVPAASKVSTSRTVTALTLDQGIALKAIGGQTVVRPKLILKPTALRSTATADYGWKYRRLITVTNNTDEVLTRVPIRLALGDTNAWVNASKAQADADDLRVMLQGTFLPVRFSTNSWNTGITYAWIVVPRVAPAEVLTLEVLYGNASATTPADFAFGEWPAIDTRGDAGTATAGAASTLTDSGKTWDTNAWQTGTIEIYAGTGSGQSRTILSNTGTVITVTSNWSTNPDNTSKYVISMSRNDFWMWAVEQTARNAGMGLWPVDPAASAPESIGFDAPAAWKRFEMLDNRDFCGQLRWSSYSASGTKYQGRLQTVRYREGAPPPPDNRLHDGVSIHIPFGIISLGADFTVTNIAMPNGTAVGKFVIRTRGGGGEQWATQFSYTTVQATPATIAAATYSFATPYPRHLYMGMLPNNEVEIPQDVPATTFAGINNRNICYCFLDPTALSVSAIGSEESIHDLYGFLRLDGGLDGSILPHRTVQLGGSGSSGRVAIPLNNNLVIDAETRKVEEWNSGLTAKVGNRRWAAAFHKWQDVDSTATAFPDTDWLLLKPLVNPISNPTAETNTTGWAATADFGDVVAALVRDAAVFDDAAGSFRLDVSTNPGHDDSFLAHIAHSDFFPVTASTVHTLTAAVRTSNGNLRPRLNLAFYDASQVFISSSSETNWAPAATTWYRRLWVATAPSNAAYLKVLGYAYGETSGITGSVYFDDFVLDGHHLLYSTIDVGIVVSTETVAGFL